MQTRTSTSTTADLPKVDSAALDAAMEAHPVVLDLVERMAGQRRQAVAERDQAIQDLAAEQKAHRATKAALEVTQDVNEKLMKSIGAPLDRLQPATAAVAPPPASDAEVAAIVEKMTPQEKALALMKAATPTRFDFRGSAPAVEGMFGR